MSNSKSVKNYAVTLVLVVLLGFLGGHRFYVGKVGTGLLFLFTGGFFFIGWIVDIFTVAFGNFTDKTGSFVRPQGQREANNDMTDDTSTNNTSTNDARSETPKKKVPTWVWIVAGVLVFGLIVQSCGGDDTTPDAEPDATVSDSADEESAPAETPEEVEPEPEAEREPFDDVVYTGSGDSILQIELPGGPDSVGIATITHSGRSNFSIWSYGEGSDLLVNEIGNYTGQVRWQAGLALIEIGADGSWSISLG